MKVLTPQESLQLLADNYIGRIGYISKGRPEIIPITYYYDSGQNSIVSYSGQGNKIDAMRKSEGISFQVDEIINLRNWKSVLLYGKYEELSGIDAKRMLHVFSEGVKNLILKKEQSSPDAISEFSSKIESSDIPIVYRINIDEYTGRQRD